MQKTEIDQIPSVLCNPGNEFTGAIPKGASYKKILSQIEKPIDEMGLVITRQNKHAMRKLYRIASVIYRGTI